MPTKKVRLKVQEALPRDIGKARARLPMAAMMRIGVKPGDFLELRGKLVGAATAWPSDPDDSDPSCVRIDGSVRRNLGVTLNEFVEVVKATVRSASSVVLAPLSKSVQLDEDFESFVKNRIKGMPLVEGSALSIVVLGNPVNFKVVKVSPRGIVVSEDFTRLKVEARLAESLLAEQRITYEDIGGLREQLRRLREIVELPLKFPELFARLGIEPPRGVLLYGPPGCGKTMIAKALANESQAKFYTINGPEIMSKYYGETEAKLREIFKDAKENAPSVVFIDEVDAIAPKREEVFGEVEKRMVAQLLSLMDGLSERGNVVVIGATNRIDDVDLALRRPGRFDREVEIGVPNTLGRLEILQIHTRGMPLASDVDLKRLSGIANGYTGADLKALCREAALGALRGVLPQTEINVQTVPTATLEKLTVDMDDFLEAYKGIVPTALREFYVEVPHAHWTDVGGLETIKEALDENIIQAVKHPEEFKKKGIEPPRGVLLYGPPGCGKTLLAKALAAESQTNLIVIRGPEILSKWMGESERAIRDIFRKARSSSPCIVLFDEIDSIGKARFSSDDAWSGETVLSQLLTQIDSLYTGEGVFIIGSTNRPDLLDPSLLRPGRLGLLFYVAPPDEKARLSILKIFAAKMPLASDVDLGSVAKSAVNFTGADLESLCREAGLSAIKRKSDTVSRSDFAVGLVSVKPGFSKEVEDWYAELDKKLRSQVIRMQKQSQYG
jgi:transitional endoplasmic reticulum ATPase